MLSPKLSASLARPNQPCDVTDGIVPQLILFKSDTQNEFAEKFSKLQRSLKRFFFKLTPVSSSPSCELSHENVKTNGIQVFLND